MTAASVVVSPDWLALREPADAAARSTRLVDDLAAHLPQHGSLVVHDLGCGTGSMLRWLAPRLPGAQHWVLHDRDPILLDHARANSDCRSADGGPVTIETRIDDITELDPAGLSGANVITASALLDMFTAEELDRFIATCAAARCPSLITISVVGRVEITPHDVLDTTIEQAFNDHQRRTLAGRTLLGPDAAAAAVESFIARGFRVVTDGSPWRLGSAAADLTRAWLQGWIDPAVEHEPELADGAPDYLRRRGAALSAGRLSVTVHHLDLLALPS
jgi:trans-aconitate methyltransferase